MKFVEEKIQKAQRAGKFKNLEKEGERLNLNENAFEAETRLAHNLIKNAGFKPKFLHDQQGLKEQIREAKQILENGAANWTGTEWSKLRWNQAVADFRESAAKLNKHIRDYNLKAPNDQFLVIPIDMDREIRRFSPETNGSS